MRLIDADALLEDETTEILAYFDGYCEFGYSRKQIEEAPTIDPVKWIPIKTRPMDEEERAEWSAKIGYDIEDEDAIIFTSQMPDDGEEVLICNRYGYVRIDTFNNDPECGCYFEDNGDMDGIVAWMPLPEPWRGEEDE